tara:strand:- start:993 stop:1325 length:333 start_codon:yes stop_codon:yes gene_type:complete
MQAKVRIEKTDIKIFEVSVTVDEKDLELWAIENYGKPEPYAEDEAPDLTLDDEGNEVPRTEPDPDWYIDYIDEYICSQDADLMFTDNCHDHSQYELESEECVVLTTKRSA